MRSFLVSAFLLAACAAKPLSSAPGAGPHGGGGQATLQPIFPPPVGARRTLEAKMVPHVKEQTHFNFAIGDRGFRAGEGRWKISESDPGWNKMYGWGPVVWVTRKGKTRVLDLRADFPSYYVSHVYDDVASGRIFLFLDFGIEGPAPVYVIWISDDAGETWFRGADMPRPPGEFPPSSLDSFFLDPSGRGTAWLKLEGANLRPELRGSVPAAADVYYRVTSPDGGRSWVAEEAPIFTSLVHPEEEQH